jgi:hypothetical protein
VVLPEAALKGGRPVSIWCTTQPCAHRSAAAVTVTGVKVSASAKAKIEAAGGRVEG